MVQLIAIVISIGILTALGIAAELWGTDSRPTYGDDHAR
jgi:hypothetical protein